MISPLHVRELAVVKGALAEPKGMDNIAVVLRDTVYQTLMAHDPCLVL